jgi:hypothetical protein
MSTDADDTAGREGLGRTSRRGFLRTAATTAAAIGTPSALAAPALAQDTGAKGTGGTGCHPSRSASSSTPSETS